MKTFFTSLVFAAACSTSFAAPCSVDGFNLSKQSHRVDEFGRLLMSAQVRNDNAAECAAQVRFHVTDKAGAVVYTKDFWYGETPPPIGRPLMVGETRIVDWMVPRALAPRAKVFTISIVDAKVPK